MNLPGVVPKLVKKGTRLQALMPVGRESLLYLIGSDRYTVAAMKISGRGQGLTKIVAFEKDK